jgi:hypothetical protein
MTGSAPDFIARLVGIGDAGVMLPAATAVTVWLAAQGRLRLALGWVLLFVAGVAVVVASKVAFLAWGFGIPAIGMRALSGHAMQTSAVMPVLLYLLLERQSPGPRRGAITAGLGFGAVIGVLLAAFGYHTWSESIAGAAVGATVSIGFLARLKRCAPSTPRVPAVMFALAAFIAGWLAWAPEHELLVRHAALYFSGQPATYSYRTWQPES